MDATLNDPLDFLGDPHFYQSQKSEITRKIKLIITIRWVVSPFVFIILTIANLIGLAEHHSFSLIPMLVNTTIILGLNTIYQWLVRRVSDLRPLVYLQLFIDTLHFTLSIYQTGGITSPFFFLYTGVILASAILVSRAATSFSLGLSVLFYSVMILLELTGVIPHKNVLTPLVGMETAASYVTLTWMFNIASLVAVTFFSTYLFSEIRKQQKMLIDSNQTLKRKVDIFSLLYNTSEAINAHTSISTMIDTILRDLLNFLNLDRAILYITKNNQCLKLFKAIHRNNDNPDTMPGDLEIPLTKEAGLTAITAITNQAINILEPEKSELMNKKLAKKIGMNPFALAPLSVKDKVIGVLGIDRNQQLGAISDEEFKILKIFANQAAIALSCYTTIGDSLELLMNKEQDIHFIEDLDL